MDIIPLHYFLNHMPRTQVIRFIEMEYVISVTKYTHIEYYLFYNLQHCQKLLGNLFLPFVMSPSMQANYYPFSLIFSRKVNVVT